MGNSESSSNTSRSARQSHSSIDLSDISGERSVSMAKEQEGTELKLRQPRPSHRNRENSSSSNSDERLQRERGGIERGQEATEQETSQLSYWYLIKHGYTELVHLIIRPPRTEYQVEDLGPSKFSFAGQVFLRVDFTVMNDRGQKLVCSHWRPSTPPTTHLMPCVIYLHGNSSCRLEALGVLRTCLAAGLTLVAFDTAGSGKSDGEYISLGYYEREDLRDVISHLRTKMNIGAIALWGRSMGAATVLMHVDRDPSIAGIVVDSAFTSLEKLVEEVVERGRQEGLTLPGFLVKIVLKFIRSSVKKRAHFSLRRLAPINHAPVSFVPALFVAAEDDSFVSCHHSEEIYAAYGGDKNLVKVEGDHNSSRPQFLLDSAAIFLQTALQVDATETVQSSTFADGIIGAGGLVPWEKSIGRASSLSISSSPTSSCRLMELEARKPEKYAAMLPIVSWACPSCTFVNPPLFMQCEICQNIYRPDHNGKNIAVDEKEALSSEVAPIEMDH